MSNRRHVIYLPGFAEYAFREIKRSTATQRANISDTDAKHFRDDSALRDFVNKQPMEHILLILTKLGKTFDLRLYDENEAADQLEFNAINQFQFPEKRVEATESMSRENIYYMSSMDVMLSAHMCSQNVHTNVYEISANTHAAAKGAKIMGRPSFPYNEQFKEVEDAMDLLNQLLLNQLNSFDWAKSTLGLEQNEIRILASLFAKRHGAMTMEDIAEGTKLDGKRAYLKKNMDKLMLERLVTSDVNHGKTVRVKKHGHQAKQTYYMITTVGVGKMMQYRNYLHSITFK